MKVYCNPLNLDYGYQHYGKGAHREGADPTLIYFKGRYYMFVSMCGGFFSRMIWLIGHFMKINWIFIVMRRMSER